MTANGASWRKAAVHVLVAIAALVVGSGLFFLAVISLISATGPWSDDPGRALAARLQAAGSPLIREVVFQPKTMIDPPEVHITVQPGVTEAQAELLWCDVIAPAGGGQFEGNLGAIIFDDAGNRLAGSVTCASPPPS